MQLAGNEGARSTTIGDNYLTSAELLFEERAAVTQLEVASA